MAIPGIGKQKRMLTSFQIIIIGFAGVIAMGTAVLMLPVSSAKGVVTSFETAFFTATSAVCVTGLVIKDTATYWSGFGQAVILGLIQIGGLGVISVILFLGMISGRRISLMQRQTMQNALSAPTLAGVVKLTRFIFILSFVVEFIGAILLIPVFLPVYGGKGIWLSIFHSISAFCNAGFDLMGDKTGNFSSLTSFSSNAYLTFIIAILIITGGIGFVTWSDVATKKCAVKEYRMQTKVVFTTTLILILVPAIFFFIFDFNGMPLKERVCLSIFQSVTPRTAGFNTADQAALSDAGKAVTMMLMLIGGSPGSTAGGVKTTTIAVLIANTIAVFKKKQSAVFFGRRVEEDAVRNASTILLMYAVMAIFSAIAISLLENLPMQTCMFETFSAIGTVGLSLGITPELGCISHYILTLLMFWGRVGGLTLIYAAFSNQDISGSKYPQENIMIG